jgi:xanthosine utilization system XapX-like protein
MLLLLRHGAGLSPGLIHSLQDVPSRPPRTVEAGFLLLPESLGSIQRRGKQAAGNVAAASWFSIASWPRISARLKSTGGEVANALVCKTSIRGFNSRPVLHTPCYFAGPVGCLAMIMLLILL